MGDQAFGSDKHGGAAYAGCLWCPQAPLLLLHLGSPDAITAYALADNELWLRYACTMVYQVSVAGYVMCICKQEGFVLAAGFLLLVAGVCKYVERTAALAFATYFEIVNSTEPIFKFMEHEDKIEPGEFNYIVVGEKQLNDCACCGGLSILQSSDIGLEIRKRLGNQYWKNVIPQYRVIDTCFKTKSSCIWKVARKYPRSFIVLWYIKLRYTSATAVEDDLKQLIFQKLQNVCSPDEDIAICKFYAFEACLSEDLKWASKMDVEDLILTWHIATAICEEHWKPNPG
ncbi:hypothetical protein SUGI_1390730 [Cryptomeria japonica]|uniref:DUF4220 domain-containing protein n=1 Tax=Cryptomeria japonica TaxID=3369 RepID=A0AAD3NTZ0_CRYJA|nr:hypothetical protein SUGI_1390730 [Cryptomeria japonica]